MTQAEVHRAAMSDEQRSEVDKAMLESLSTWFEMRAKGYAGPHSFNDWDVAFLLARAAINIAPPSTPIPSTAA